jgi:lipopolysaccharide transport system ATP-binding protein
MSDIAIRVENLGKRYAIGKRERYKTLRDTLTDALAAPFRRFRNRSSASGNGAPDHIWALKEISFEIPRGEVMGVIGRNGAGKSTLLKVLSRITEPTEGLAEIHGRVGSLLEVGTGFHPELTGRENIYLNGAILGMRKAEIARKFDEIVAFAEIETFLDTPVKHYSSGMYMRLAFAVAAHLEPEILVVDEVLAVGDAQFQKKCLGKMEDVAAAGRTVMFVSHNIAAIEALCSSAVLLSGGRLVARGEAKAVIQRYMRSLPRGVVIPIRDRRDRQGTGAVRFISISLTDDRGQNISGFQCGYDAVLLLSFENNTPQAVRLRLALGVDDEFGQRVLLLDTALLGADIASVAPGPGAVRVLVPKLCLLPGRYHLTLYVTANGTISDWIKNAGSFDVDGGDFFGTGQLPTRGQGLFVTRHSFDYYIPAPDAETTAAEVIQAGFRSGH